MINEKIPTLSKQEITELGQKLAQKYISRARENVNVKKIFPPNRYTFTTEEFRPIEGWDKEWYNVMYEWMQVLKTQGWKEKWFNEHGGETLFPNFQYLYDEELPSCRIDWDPFATTNLSEMTGEKCIQLSLTNEEAWKLSCPRSEPIDWEKFARV